jgi:FAD/FMN-containing dehydrogenase
MARAYGLAIDNLLSARVVTATGEALTATPIENPDLFWAIRGGGGNFGIVTEFTFRLAPVDHIVGGFLALPITRETMRGFLDLSWNAPEELTTLGHILRLPPLPFVPAEWVGQPVLAILACWSGDVSKGQAALDPFRALGTPIVDLISEMPYPEIYKLTDHQAGPHGAAIRMMFADDLSDASIDSLIAAIEQPSSPMDLVQIRAMGGAAGRVDPCETAFSHRDQRYFLSIIGLWLDPSDTGEAHFAWAEKTFDAVKHDGHGVYVNFLQDEGEARIREAYGDANYERLARIKKFYDPTNLFNHAQNIQPAS